MLFLQADLGRILIRREGEVFHAAVGAAISSLLWRSNENQLFDAVEKVLYGLLKPFRL